MNLQILGKEFTVSVERSNNIDVWTQEDRTLGCCLASRGLILLNPDQSEESINCTLLHEIIEAVNEMLELGLEHRQITGLDAGIYSAIKSHWQPVRIKKGKKDVKMR